MGTVERDFEFIRATYRRRKTSKNRTRHTESYALYAIPISIPGTTRPLRRSHI